MPRSLEIGQLVELGRQALPEQKVDFEPTVEVLGKLCELSLQKSGGMDAFQKPMSG